MKCSSGITIILESKKSFERKKVNNCVFLSYFRRGTFFLMVAAVLNMILNHNTATFLLSRHRGVLRTLLNMSKPF